MVKGVSDKEHKELTPEWIYQIFEDKYINNHVVFQVLECNFRRIDGMMAEVTIVHAGDSRVIVGNGNGRLDAVSNAIQNYFDINYELSVYEEHALTSGSSSKAASYVEITCNGRKYWGVGIHNDIIQSSIDALIAAVNQIDSIRDRSEIKDERINKIMNYIQTHYQTVTLDDLSEEMFLSKPYISKYIKDKLGVTFGDIVKNIRLNKARALLKNGNMKIENVAESVGYQNVEHFNRLFKKKCGMTPVQYRYEKISSV